MNCHVASAWPKRFPLSSTRLLADTSAHSPIKYLSAYAWKNQPCLVFINKNIVVLCTLIVIVPLNGLRWVPLNIARLHCYYYYFIAFASYAEKSVFINLIQIFERSRYDLFMEGHFFLEENAFFIENERLFLHIIWPESFFQWNERFSQWKWIFLWTAAFSMKNRKIFQQIKSPYENSF